MRDKVDEVFDGSEISPEEEEVGVRPRHAMTQTIVEGVGGDHDDDRPVVRRMGADLANDSHSRELVAVGILRRSVDDNDVHIGPLVAPGQRRGVVEGTDDIDERGAGQCLDVAGQR